MFLSLWPDWWRLSRRKLLYLRRKQNFFQMIIDCNCFFACFSHGGLWTLSQDARLSSAPHQQPLSRIEPPPPSSPASLLIWGKCVARSRGEETSQLRPLSLQPQLFRLRTVSSNLFFNLFIYKRHSTSGLFIWAVGYFLKMHWWHSWSEHFSDQKWRALASRCPHKC